MCNISGHFPPCWCVCNSFLFDVTESHQKHNRFSEQWATLWFFYGLLNWNILIYPILSCFCHYMLHSLWGAYMEAVFHIFRYVKSHLQSKLVLYPTYHNWTHIDWHTAADWKELWGHIWKQFYASSIMSRAISNQSLSLILPITIEHILIGIQQQIGRSCVWMWQPEPILPGSAPEPCTTTYVHKCICQYATSFHAKIVYMCVHQHSLLPLHVTTVTLSTCYWSHITTCYSSPWWILQGYSYWNGFSEWMSVALVPNCSCYC
jgi:hypothetical protein